MASLLPQAYGERCAFGLSPDGARILEDLKTGMTLLDERRQALGRLSAPYREGAIAALDIHDLKATWAQSEASWWLKGTLLKGKVAKQLRHAVKDKTKPDCPNDLPTALAGAGALAGTVELRCASASVLGPPRSRTWNVVWRQCSRRRATHKSPAGSAPHSVDRDYGTRIHIAHATLAGAPPLPATRACRLPVCRSVMTLLEIGQSTRAY